MAMCRLVTFRSFVVGASVLAVALLGFSSVASGDDPPPEVRKGEVVVELKPDASIEAVNARFNTSTIQRIYGTNFYRLRTPQGRKEKKWRKRLSKDPDVLTAAFNQVVVSPISVFGRAVLDFPESYAEPGRSQSEYLGQNELAGLLSLAEARERSTGDGIIVAVIDTGIDLEHPDLKNNLWLDSRTIGDIAGDNLDNDNDGLTDDSAGWDFIDDDNDPSEFPDDPLTTVAGHGTFIAGLITMVAPDCRIMPVRAFPPDGVSDAFTVAQAIKYATDHGAHVINLSFGSPQLLGIPGVLVEAINYAHERGAVLVAAVGNENSARSPQFPATFDQAVAVAAIDLTNRKAPFSNFGPEVDVTAPGMNIISTYPRTGGVADYASWSGTSFAAPFTSAEAALILQLSPRAAITKTLIEETSIPIDRFNPPELTGMLGKGRIAPLAALERLYLSDDKLETINRSEIKLTAPFIGAAFSGEAAISVAGERQQFEIGAAGLRPHAPYRVAVNGLQLGTVLTADGLGGFRAAFSNFASSVERRLPEELSPVTRIRRVEVFDGLARIVLIGEFSPPSSDIRPIDQADHKEAVLQPTGLLFGTRGRARAEVGAEREKLLIEAEGLEPNALYRIVIDGVDFGLAPASTGAIAVRTAFLRALFTSDGSSGRRLPVGIDTVFGLVRVEIRDSFGRAVLRGDFQAGGGVAGDGGGAVGAGIPVGFIGMIERLPAGSLLGDWVVNGRIVNVTGQTRIKQEIGPVRVGALVVVKGITQAGGSAVTSVLAHEVEVKSNTAAVRSPNGG